MSGNPGIINVMPTNEEGEFELVLGNKQLLSVFFLVVLLLGVFFSMGYIVGRNTAPASSSLSASNRQPPIMVDSTGRVPGGAAPIAAVAPPPVDISKPSPSDEGRQPKPEPVKPPRPEPVVAKPEPPKPEPLKVAVAKPEPVKPEPVKPPKPEPVKPPKPEPVKPAPAASKGGNYLQVVATKRADAEQVVAKLGKQGFAAIISPVPNSDLVRVLVGPLGDSDAVSKTKNGLTSAGFKPMLRKF